MKIKCSEEDEDGLKWSNWKCKVQEYKLHETKLPRIK